MDISDLANPQVIGTFNPTAWQGIEDVAVAGTTVYAVGYKSGLWALDLADPTTPALLGRTDTPGSEYSVTLHQGFAFVGAGQEGGLQIIDATPPPAPDVVESVTACDLFNQCSTATYSEGLSAAQLGQTPPARPVAAVDLTQSAAPDLTVEFVGLPARVEAIRPVTLTVSASAQSGLKSLALSVDGATVETITWPDAATTAAIRDFLWTPPGQGIFALSAQVNDWAGNPPVDSLPVDLLVDTTPPAVTLTTDAITDRNFTAVGFIRLTGTVSDAVGIESLHVRLNDGPWQATTVPTTTQTWTASLYTGSPVPPSGDTTTIGVRATDLAGRTTVISRLLASDAAPPVGFILAAGYVNNLGATTVISPNMTITDLSAAGLTVAWTEASDASGVARYLAGWTTAPTLTLPLVGDGGLTAYPSTARSHTQPVGDVQKLYAHVVAEDVHGNQAMRTIGPIFVDSATHAGSDHHERACRPVSGLDGQRLHPPGRGPPLQPPRGPSDPKTLCHMACPRSASGLVRGKLGRGRRSLCLSGHPARRRDRTL